MSKVAQEIDSIARVLKSIVETLAPAKARGGMGFQRLSDLHTEFSPLVMHKLVRYLEGNVLIAKARNVEELTLWTTEEGQAALRNFSETAWWRLARDFVGS